MQKAASAREAAFLISGGGGRIRTSVSVRWQIYSLLPLATRAPLHEVNAHFLPVAAG